MGFIQNDDRILLELVVEQTLTEQATISQIPVFHTIPTSVSPVTSRLAFGLSCSAAKICYVQCKILWFRKAFSTYETNQALAYTCLLWTKIPDNSWAQEGRKSTLCRSCWRFDPRIWWSIPPHPPTELPFHMPPDWGGEDTKYTHAQASNQQNGKKNWWSSTQAYAKIQGAHIKTVQDDPFTSLLH